MNHVHPEPSDLLRISCGFVMGLNQRPTIALTLPRRRASPPGVMAIPRCPDERGQLRQYNIEKGFLVLLAVTPYSRSTTAFFCYLHSWCDLSSLVSCQRGTRDDGPIRRLTGPACNILQPLVELEILQVLGRDQASSATCIDQVIELDGASRPILAAPGGRSRSSHRQVSLGVLKVDTRDLGLLENMSTALAGMSEQNLVGLSADNVPRMAVWAIGSNEVGEGRGLRSVQLEGCAVLDHETGLLELVVCVDEPQELADRWQQRLADVISGRELPVSRVPLFDIVIAK